MGKAPEVSVIRTGEDWPTRVEALGTLATVAAYRSGTASRAPQAIARGGRALVGSAPRAEKGLAEWRRLATLARLVPGAETNARRPE